jgi:CheY-like chemotaxis protein
VLVVDDNPVNLMLISALMEARGVLPLLAADGAEAAALACEMHFDLILMDLQMPILDGWEATAAIRRFESACSRPGVPVVAYSSTPPNARVVEARGMNGILAKPCSDQDLDDCLVRWCPGFHSEPSAPAAPHENTARPAASQRPGSSALLR